MRMISKILVVFALAVLPLTAMAKEKGGGKKKDPPAPVAPATPAAPEVKATSITFTGTLADKAEGAPTNILAQLTDVKGDNAPTGPLSLLGGDDATSAQIKDLLAKKAKVAVTGTINGTTMTVTSLKESP